MAENTEKNNLGNSAENRTQAMGSVNQEEVERTQVLHTVHSGTKDAPETVKKETFFERTIASGIRSTRLKLKVAKEIENDAVEEKKGGEFRNFRRIFNTVFSRVGSFMVERSNVDEALLGGEIDHTQITTTAEDGENQEDPAASFGNLKENYVITRKFAEGGQAIISVAEDLQIGRIVGIKTLRSELLNSQEARNHFIEEARISGQLEHPSIIPVYRLCSDPEKNLHMAMKLIKGQTLQHYLANLVNYYVRKGMNYFDEQRSLKHRLDIFLAVCDGLEYAHSRKIIHCDLKPENIMIGAYHDTYLMDWGIAHTFQDDDGLPLEQHERRDRINGTPRYLSPEAAMGYPCDQRSDIFSMGVILFEIVTLRSAFIGKDTNEILRNVAAGRMEKVCHRFRAAIDPDLRAIIHKATALKREDRYQNIRELSEDLRRYQVKMEVSARPDNLPRRIIRWMRRHHTTTLLCGSVAMMIWLCFTAYSLRKNYENEKMIRERSIVVGRVYTQALKGIADMQKQSMMLDFCAFDAAKMSGMILHGKLDVTESEHNLPYRCSVLKSALLPDGVQKYGKQGVVDFSSLCFSAPASLPLPEIEYYRRKFRLMTPYFQQIFLQNCRSEDWESAQKASPKNMYQLQYGLLWLYVGLKNGMYFSYPANAFYDENYDPRSRIWYREAEADLDHTSWSRPYMGYAVKEVMVTISRAITDPVTGEFYGVAGLDFPLSTIRSIVFGEASLTSFFCDKMVVNLEGQVLIDSRKPDQQYQEDRHSGRLDFPYFEDPAAWEVISKQETGVLLNGPGNEFIYVFSKIKDSRYYYVIRLNYRKFKKLDRLQQEKLLNEGKNERS